MCFILTGQGYLGNSIQSCRGIINNFHNPVQIIIIAKIQCFMFEKNIVHVLSLLHSHVHYTTQMSHKDKIQCNIL